MEENLKTSIDALGGRIVAWRRELHRHPEVAHCEKWTSNYLRAHFRRLGIPVRRMAGTRGITIMTTAVMTTMTTIRTRSRTAITDAKKGAALAAPSAALAADSLCQAYKSKRAPEGARIS